MTENAPIIFATSINAQILDTCVHLRLTYAPLITPVTEYLDVGTLILSRAHADALARLLQQLNWPEGGEGRPKHPDPRTARFSQFSARAKRWLDCQKIHNVEDLLSTNISMLPKVRSCGRTTMREIEKFVRENTSPDP